MSEYIKNEIKRLEQRRKGIIAQLQRAIFAAEFQYDGMIKEVKSKCQHKEAISDIFKQQMGFCEYCGIDL